MQNIKILKYINFFSHFKLYAPIAILYFTQVSGSFALGMSIFAISEISAALFEIPTGVFSDTIGRRKTIILGSLIAVFYTTSYAIGQSYLFLVIGAILEGLSWSFYSGNNDALLYDELAAQNKKDQYSETLGKLSSYFQLALAISAILGGIIGNFSFAWIMWISVVAQAITFILSFYLKEPKVRSEKTGNIYAHLNIAFSSFIKNKRIRLVSLSSTIMGGIGQATYHFQAAFFKLLWPIWAIGLAKTTTNIGAFLSFRYSGLLFKKIKPVKYLLAINVYGRVVNIIAATFPTIFSPLLMVSGAIWYGATQTARTTLLQKEFTDNQRATMGSLNSLFKSLFFGIVSVLLGFTADKLTPAIAILIAQIVLVPTVWINWKLLKDKS